MTSYPDSHKHVSKIGDPPNLLEHCFIDVPHDTTWRPTKWLRCIQM